MLFLNILLLLAQIYHIIPSNDDLPYESFMGLKLMYRCI